MPRGKKLTVYPFQRDFIAELDYLHRTGAYGGIFPVAQRGLGLDGRDAGCADNRGETGIRVSCDYKAAVDKSDALLIAPCAPNAKLRGHIADAADYAAGQGKEILCALRPTEELTAEVRRKCESRGTPFTCCADVPDPADPLPILNNSLQEFHTPVVFVAGISENVDKFDLQLSLREGLSKEGYRLSQIGSRNDCELFGFHSFPEFMFGRSYSEKDKILRFNAYVKRLKETEAPDLILVGIPGGSMQYSRTVTADFGIQLYLVSQAVSPDYAVVGVTFEEYYPFYFDMLENSFRYKYGFAVDCFHVANAQFDANRIQESKTLRFNYIPSAAIRDFVSGRYANEQYLVLHALTDDGRRRMCGHLTGRLSEYSCMAQMNG